MQQIKKVFVVGSGLMGGGIAQVSAVAGYEVVMHDVTDERTDMGMAAIKKSLERFLSKEKITQEQFDGALARLKPTTKLEDAADADLCVEAVFENIDVKREVFGTLDKVCPAHTILASNTSAIPISSIAAATQRPGQVVGTHFFSPVPMMRLCEIITGLETSEETLAAAETWAKSLGKTTVSVLKDHAGFIANRIFLPMIMEAISLLEVGVASPDDIDTTMKLGFNHPMGPLELADMIGIDVLQNAVTAVYLDTQDHKFTPPPLMKRMVAAGLFGQKSKKGFYDYSTGEKVSYWKL